MKALFDMKSGSSFGKKNIISEYDAIGRRGFKSLKDANKAKKNKRGSLNDRAGGSNKLQLSKKVFKLNNSIAQV